MQCRLWGDLQIYATTKDTLVCKDHHYQLQNTFDDDADLAVEIFVVRMLQVAIWVYSTLSNCSAGWNKRVG